MLNHHWNKIWRTGVVIVCLLTLLTPVGSGQTLAQSGKPEAITGEKITASHFDVSAPLRDIRPVLASQSDGFEPKELPEPPMPFDRASEQPDAAIQSALGPAAMPLPIVNFTGLTNTSNVYPPSPSGEVGRNHYVLMGNLSFAIYNKSGSLVFGPALNNILWSGFGGACQVQNSGNPIVLYNQLADRWIMTQPTYTGPEYFLCMAVSTSGDPTGSYYRYSFSTDAYFPDIPRYAVWPDAIYASTREFDDVGFAGIRVYAFNWADLSTGIPLPRVIKVALTTEMFPPSALGDGLTPADLEGDILPPPGSPAYFLGSMDDGGPYAAAQDALTVYKFTADFAPMGNSTLSLAASPSVAAFDSIFPCSPSRNCIPQPETTTKLDILSYRQRLLWRVTYRNFGDHEALLMNQSVEASPGMAGIRWYEVRNPNTAPLIYQYGTYAPGIGDGIHRWAGSIAMDKQGDIAIGYSASSSSVFPSIFYTGRLASDPLGQMAQGEGVIMNGTGSQTGTSGRWGDITSMTVDPVDGCTFWYAGEYVPVTSAVGWVIRVGSFKFPGCRNLPVYLPLLAR